MYSEKFKFEKSFLQTKELTDTCEKISSLCNDFDGLNTPFFIDAEYDNSSKLPYLYYCVFESQIVGFLSVYPIDTHNAEICGFVLPEYRRKKIASHLFAMMVCDFSDVSFQLSLPPENDFGKCFANKMGFQYCATECSMTIKKEQFASTQNSLSLVSEKSEDGLSPDGSLIIHGISDGTEIGSCLISDFDRIVCIHDVEIYEKYRGKGYGYQLICALLHHVFPKYDSAILHVTKENEPAYRLYKKVGFEVVEELEYYEV